MASILLLLATQGIILSQELALKSKYAYSTPALDAAQQLYSQKKYPEALAAFEAIIAEAEAQQNYEEVVYAMEKKALALRRLGRYDGAVSTMDQAILLAKGNLPGDHFLISKMYYTRGSTDHILRDYYDARAYMDTAQIYYENASTYDSTAHYRIMEYKYYAYQYSEGSPDTLLKYLDKLVFLEKARNGSPNRVSNLLQGYPTIFIQKGDFSQALAYAIQAYRFAIENKDRISTRYFVEAQFYLTQVLFYRRDFKRALDISKEAVPFLESTPIDQMPEYYSFNNLIGLIHMSLGDSKTALEYFKVASEIPLGVGDMSNQRQNSLFQARQMINLGLCYESLGQMEKAKTYLEGSLIKMKNLMTSPSPNLHDNYEYLGDFYSREAKLSDAITSYDSALRNGLSSFDGGILDFPSTSKTVNYSFVDLRTLSKKAESLKRQGVKNDFDKKYLLAAKKYVELTAQVLLKNREEFLESEGKLFLSENFKRLYETGISTNYELFRLTKDRRFFENAMSFARQSKAILFLEQSHEFTLVNNNFISPSLKEEFFNSKSNIERLQRAFYELINVSVTGDSILSLNEELLKARLDNENIKKRIKEELRGFDRGEAFFEGLLQNEAMGKLEEGQALIEFFFGVDHVYILGRDFENIAFHRVEIDSSLLSSLNSVITLTSRAPKVKNIQEEFEEFSENAFFLYRALIEPSLKDLDGSIDRLIVVPDEILSRLAFGALVQNLNGSENSFDQLQYLLLKYKFQYLLSSELYGNRKATRNASGQLLGIGFKESTSVHEGYSMGSLPGTEKEIAFLQSSISGTYLPNGTKKDFLNKARDYDVLHLAVHGKADSSSRYESSLIFNGASDNVLNTNDLYLAGLQARLTVLSACESGRGQINQGEGTFSIARGFALVGIPSIVMSLWKVNDKITSEMMVDMYDNFVNHGVAINDALHDSKLQYLGSGDEYSAHPYYWASFLHLGEDIMLDNGDNLFKDYLWYVLTTIMSGAILYVVIRRKRKRA
ncbi:hypothetical protein BFP97_14955 [Roseivirga sp. 4D4]|uniref:CHAT domain-containing protein n=1 Tax=Roseivirga sp. 4D4 TaxID=1889784 RepID=UPI000852F846|nr:CHAT domain-containing protein [Roseivirga sp. 4D4]OEK02743.1 hypothetical protein BFP97_14955 [Roseivirga sp. 4D4]